MSKTQPPPSASALASIRKQVDDAELLAQCGWASLTPAAKDLRTVLNALDDALQRNAVLRQTIDDLEQELKRP